MLMKNNLIKVKKRKNKKKHFMKRERLNNYGEMEQFDGSYHD
jgi:hypothetical protein